MTGDIPDPKPGEARTPSQKERRARIMAATLELLDESGPRALQMREVTARSGVALATVYRYFPSKDYLVVMALLSWSERIVADVNELAGLEDPGERLSAMLAATVDALDEHRSYAAAVVLAAASDDVLVLEGFASFRALLITFLDRGLAGMTPAEADVVRVIAEGVWLRALIELGFLNASADAVKDTFERVVRLCFGR